MFTINLAEHVFRIQNHYAYIERLCADYIITGDGREPAAMRQARSFALGNPQEVEPDWIKPAPLIEVSAAERMREQPAGETFQDQYLESTAVYRKICELLIPEDIFLFHCSAISIDGQGVLFAAPSGTGKSTHAKLWKQRFGGRVTMINDDKPLLRVTEDEILAYGTPWSGKHELQTNIRVPVKAVFLLERGADNTVAPVSVREAYPMLLNQTYRPDHAGLMQKTLLLLNRFTKQVPYYKLSCTISEQAVETVYDALRQDKIL